MLRNGDNDFAAIPSGKIKETVEEYGQSEDGFTSTPGKQVLLGTELSTYFLIPSPADPVMTDVKVRRAISLAINRQSIVDALFEGSRMPAASIMPTSIDDSRENTWEDCKYDPEVDQAMFGARQIAVVAIVIEAVAGIGAGIVSAIKRYSFWDILVTLTTSMLVAMPAFWPGLLLQLVFGIWLKDLTGGVFALPISGVRVLVRSSPAGPSTSCPPSRSRRSQRLTLRARCVLSSRVRWGAPRLLQAASSLRLRHALIERPPSGGLSAIAAEYCVDYAAVCAFCFRVETVINARAGRARDDR